MAVNELLVELSLLRQPFYGVVNQIIVGLSTLLCDFCISATSMTKRTAYMSAFIAAESPSVISTSSKKARSSSSIASMLSSHWTFEVGECVHPCSWGKRRGGKYTNHSNNDLEKKRLFSASEAQEVSFLWSSSDFLVQGKIGKGHFGTVYRAEYLRCTGSRAMQCLENKAESGATTGSTMKVVAVKRLSKEKLLKAKLEGGRALDLLQMEVNIQSHLQHRNILPLMGFFEDHSTFNLVLQYAPEGDLLAFMHHNMSSSTKERIDSTRRIMWQLCQAVYYLHSRHVAHRDIKPENVVLCHEGDTAKLCDFGWSTWWRPGQKHSTLCGTPEYLAPELLRTKVVYSAEFVDPWALGVLAVELVTHVTPFCAAVAASSSGWESGNYNKGQNNQLIFGNIRTFRNIEETRLIHHCDTDFQHFVARFLQVTPYERMSAEQALDHSFFEPLRPRRRAILTNIQPPSVAQLRQLFQHAAGRQH